MRRALTICLLALALGLWSIPASWAQSDPFQAGRELFQQHRWAEAATAFTAAEEQHPGATDARLYLGKCYVNLEKWDPAFQALQSYLGDHPQSDDAAYLMAFIRFRQDKPAESLNLYTAAAKIKTPESDDLKIVSLDYVLLNDYIDAARYLEMALQMNPQNTEARYHLGRVRYQLNQFDAAIAAFQAVLKSEPTDVRAEDNLGLCLEAKDQVDQAMAAYRKAIEWDASAKVHNVEPYLDFGILLSKSNQPQEAASELEKAVQIDANSSRAHYELGKVDFSLGKVPDAEQQAKEAVRLDAQNASAHYLLGRIYHRTGQTELETREFNLTQQLMSSSREHSTGMATGRDR
jgi:tetratricopeptide (TPR) repeat protein